MDVCASPGPATPRPARTGPPVPSLARSEHSVNAGRAGRPQPSPRWVDSRGKGREWRKKPRAGPGAQRSPPGPHPCCRPCLAARALPSQVAKSPLTRGGAGEEDGPQPPTHPIPILPTPRGRWRKHPMSAHPAGGSGPRACPAPPLGHGIQALPGAREGRIKESSGVCGRRGLDGCLQKEEDQEGRRGSD